MALSAEEIQRVEELLKPDSGIDDATRTELLKQRDAYRNEHLDQWAKAGPSPVANQTPAPGKLGVTGIIGQDQPAQPSPEDQQVAAVASQLDPRFDLVPQALALQPATTHPGGDQAAEAGWKAGDKGEVRFAYEPPVAVVRKQLLENPALLRMLRDKNPPSPDEIVNLSASDPLYKDVANYMWGQAAKKAMDSGQTLIRYSQAPWSQDGSMVPSLEGLKNNIQGAAFPVKDALGAVLLGVDDTANFGAGRAAMEHMAPKANMHVPGGGDVLGLNENAEHETKDLVQYGLEDNRGSYALGQLAGSFAPWALANRVIGGIAAGGAPLVEAITKSKAGQLAARAPELLKQGAGALKDAALGTTEAALTQAGQEGVQMGRDTFNNGLPSGDRLAEAAERVKDVGADASKYALGGSVLSRLGGAAAEGMRGMDRYGGAIGRTEPNMNYGPASVITGPRLNKETKAVVKEARKTGHMPGDIIAEKIQPKMAEVAERRATSVATNNLAEREGVFGTAEGRATMPVTNLQETALKRLRAHVQPNAAGGHAVDESVRPYQKVFNRHVADVTTTPVEGAIKLSPSEVDSVLSPHWRHRLMEGEVAAARAGKPAEDIERAAYLKVAAKNKGARDALDDEIENEIEDRLQARTKDPDAEDWPEKGSAEYRQVEQEVLNERVEQEAFEETNGNVGDLLRRQGKDVYVVPYRYDAERTEELIKGLKDEDLQRAALADREARPLEGKPGGWSRMREKQDAAQATADKAVKETSFENVAKHAELRPGDKQQADLLRSVADEAGVRGELDRARSINEAVGLGRQSRFMGPQGERKNILSTQAWGDAALLRSFPILRALEPGGVVGGGTLGRAALLGQREDDAQRFASESGPRANYERAYAKRMKEIAAEKEEGRKERQRHRTEKHR